MAPKMKLGGNSEFDIRRIPNGGPNITIGATIVYSANREDKTKRLKGVCFFVAELPEAIFINAS